VAGAAGDEQRRQSDYGCGGVRADRAAEMAAHGSVQWRRRLAAAGQQRRLGSGGGCEEEGFF